MFFIFKGANWKIWIKFIYCKGFQNRKKVNNGKECSFLKHVGDASSAHNYFVRCFNNPKNTMAQTDTLMVKQNEILVAAASVMLGTQLIALGNDI